MAATFPRGAAKALATVTTPAKGIYMLSMGNLPDNRLTPVSILRQPALRGRRAGCGVERSG